MCGRENKNNNQIIKGSELKNTTFIKGFKLFLRKSRWRNIGGIIRMAENLVKKLKPIDKLKCFQFLLFLTNFTKK